MIHSVAKDSAKLHPTGEVLGHASIYLNAYQPMKLYVLWDPYH